MDTREIDKILHKYGYKLELCHNVNCDGQSYYRAIDQSGDNAITSYYTLPLDVLYAVRLRNMTRLAAVENKEV